MSLKSRIGLDGFDLALHLTVTGVVLFWIGAANQSPHDATLGAAAVTTVSLVLLGIRRHFGLKRLGRSGLSTGEMAAERIAELEQRVAELEVVQARILEVEERLDFAERLLARAGPERLELSRPEQPS